MSFIAILLAVLFLTLNNHGLVGGRSTLSSEEQLELNNKIAVTEFGHTYDCVDIQQQPALSHPHFKNYKVQMEPSFSLKQSIGKTSPLYENSEATISRVDCPQGTVPIRRTEKEHLDRMKSFAESYDSSIHPQTKDQPGRQFAILKSHGRKPQYHGIQSYINVQQPVVSYDQLSASQLWIETTINDEFNSLQAGWIVCPELYRDNFTHFFSYYKEAASTYKVAEISTGGTLSRHNLHVQQVGPDTITELSTFDLCVNDQTQDVHIRLVLDHPKGISQQLHKCIVAHSSGKVVFDGNVKVNRYTQNTDADQLTRSLLLEPRLKPNLQIIADDVKCSHGAAISDLEEDQLFYFQA